MMRLTLAVVAVLVAAGAFYLWAPFTAGSRLSIAPNDLDFGEVALGAEKRLSIVATNLGDQTVSLRRVRGEGPFELSHSGLTLEPGQAQGLVVTFHPTEPGPAAGTLTLSSGDETFSIAARGSALDAPAIQVTPLRLPFGEVAVNGEAKGAFTITNTGGGSLVVESLATGRPFQAEVDSVEVAPGTSRTLEVRFRPQTAGAFRNKLQIRSNDPDKTSVTIALEGAGVASAPTASIDVSPGALDFGTVSTCAPERRWLTIRNAGGSALTISGMQMPAPFSAPARSRRIEPGGNFQLPVAFSPAHEGRLGGPLAIYSNDPAQGVVRVDLRGAGRPCAPGDETRAAQAAEIPPVWAGLRGTSGGAGGATSGTREPSTGEREPTDPRPDASDSAAVAGGSRVRLASYSADISEFHLDAVGFDPASGTLSLEGLRLPVVQAALGEFFMFSPTRGQGQVDPLGETQITLPIELLDPDGSPAQFSLTLTTGTSSVIVNDRQVSVTGSPLDGSGKATLVGMTVMPKNTAFSGEAMRIVLNVQVP